MSGWRGHGELSVISAGEGIAGTESSTGPCGFMLSADWGGLKLVRSSASLTTVEVS